MNAHGQTSSGGPSIPKNNLPLDIKNLVDDPLIQEEERNTGAVTWATYKKYFTFAGGLAWVPTIFLVVVLYQTCQGMLPASTILARSLHNNETSYSGDHPSFGILDR